MPVQGGGTLVQRLPHMSHASTGLRHLYEKVESGTLPTVQTKDALCRPARDKTVRYPHVKRVGPYLLGRTIGEGSFAKVKEALHSVVGEKVAVKIIDKKEARKDPYLRKNMRREASLLQSLRQHPNIISLYEVMETDNNFYMVLDLCTGGALLDRICSKKCLQEDEARRYVKQIVSAVDHIHQAGILHRDLKVENLLLDENNNIKIIDFGLSNFIGYSSSSSTKGTGVRAEFQATQCGSPAYAAPEIIANKKYGPKVDVWSIGVNTFAMLAGSLPFTVEPFNIKLLLKKINNREMAEIPTNLTNECKDFIRRLLHPDPRKRYSILEAMNHKWLVGDVDAVIRPRTASSAHSGRISRMDLETDILDYIWTNMGYNISHVTDSVISKRCDEYSAMYYLLLRRRDRHHVKMLKRLETKDESGSDAKDSGISAPKLYDEATAMELAGRKNGSLHFKMALLLQQEKEDNATNDNDSDADEPEPEGINQKDQEIQEPISGKHVMTSSSALPNKDQKNLSFKLDVEDPNTNRSKTMATEEVRRDWTQTSNKVTQSMSDNHASVKTQIYKLSTAHRVNLTFRQSELKTQTFSDHYNYRKHDTKTSMRASLAPTRTANVSVDIKTLPRPTNISVDTKASPRPTNISLDTKTSPRPTNICVDTKTSPRPTNICVDMKNSRRPFNISIDTKASPRPTNISLDTKTSPRPTNISVDLKTLPMPIWRQSDSIDTNNLTNRIGSMDITPRDGFIKIDKDTNNNNLKDKTEPFSIQSTNPSQNDAIVKYKDTRHTQHVPIDFATKRRKLKIVKRRSFDNSSFILRRPVRIIKKSSSNDSKMIVRVTGRPKTPLATEVGIKRKGSIQTANHKRKQDTSRGSQRKKCTSKKDCGASERCKNPYKCEKEKSVKKDIEQDSLSSQDVPEAAPPLTKLSRKKSPLNLNANVRKPMFTEASAESVV